MLDGISQSTELSALICVITDTPPDKNGFSIQQSQQPILFFPFIPIPNRSAISVGFVVGLISSLI
jgi:hypothetical protein